jgi:hypothetical protein
LFGADLGSNNNYKLEEEKTAPSEYNSFFFLSKNLLSKLLRDEEKHVFFFQFQPYYGNSIDKEQQWKNIAA